MKFFAVSFVLLSMILTGCTPTGPEPPPKVEEKVEEKIEEKKEVLDETQKDLEHKKKIEEQERQQEQILKELLKEESAAEAEETVTSPAVTDESELVAVAEKETQEVIHPEPQKVDTVPAENTAKVETQELVQEESPEVSQESVEEESKLPSQQVSTEVSSDGETTQETSQIASQESPQGLIPETSVEASKEDSAETLPEKTAVIVSPQQEPEPPMFMPESPLALSSAQKLVPCSKVPETMEAVYRRLQKTKEIIIADRRLRDRKNDSLMPVVHFDFDQIKIKPDYRKLLRQQSSCVMKALEARGDLIIQIEGHADERGSEEYNMALGHRRANAIANAIMAYLTNPELTRIISYGEEFPLVRYSGKSAWARNRRVEFTLLLKQ